MISEIIFYSYIHFLFGYWIFKVILRTLLIVIITITNTLHLKINRNEAQSPTMSFYSPLSLLDFYNSLFKDTSVTGIVGEGDRTTVKMHRKHKVTLIKRKPETLMLNDDNIRI